jgi:hypothetical protein
MDWPDNTKIVKSWIIFTLSLEPWKLLYGVSPQIDCHDKSEASEVSFSCLNMQTTQVS